MGNELILVAFYVVTLIYSVIIHEVSHGWMALWLGDLTAKYADRLNLNPMKHIDLFGSVIVPAAMLLLTKFSFAFGWAKPVPYNPYNLRNQQWGPALVAFAGPLANIVVALVAVAATHILPLGLLAKEDIFSRFLSIISGQGDFFDRWGLFADSLSGSFSNIFFGLLLLVIFWNVLLAFFNLIPIPPLDGSKLLYSLFSFREETIMTIERYGFVFLLLLIFFFSAPIAIVLNASLGFFFGLVL